ncbi:MAG: hypothetical protein NTW21_12950 [Verrucomicrobia bacterium]|nr:hypothetical protein [Verrucomicrobiota bacterium]
MPAKKIASPAKPATAPVKKVAARKTTATKAAATKPTAARNSPARATREEIAQAAYLNFCGRQAIGLPGDPHSDWIEAERRLSGD